MSELETVELFRLPSCDSKESEWAGRWIYIPALEKRLKLHYVYFEQDGRVFYWYVPLPEGCSIHNADGEMAT